MTPHEEFTSQDLIRAGLAGGADAASRRARLGAILGLGWANARTFCKRLNSYGVTREEFAAALSELEKADAVRDDGAAPDPLAGREGGSP